MSPYTDTYEAIKSVPINLRATTACDNPGTKETTIIFRKRLDIIVNQLRANGTSVPDNINGRSQVFPTVENATIIGVATRTTTENELPAYLIVIRI